MPRREWAPPDLRLKLFEVTFSCGGAIDRRLVWAPSEGSAGRVVRDHASDFGLPHELVVVRRVRAAARAAA